jgi:hypothetical protein
MAFTHAYKGVVLCHILIAYQLYGMVYLRLENTTVVVPGEPRDIERVMRSAERGRWKSAHKGTALAAYSPAHPVLRGGVIVLSPPAPTTSVNRSATALLAPAPCVIPDARVNNL